MSLLVYIDWQGEPKWVGTIHSAERGQTVTFQYTPEWLEHVDAFSIDPTSLPLQEGAFHSTTLFSAMQDCGPDRWGRVLVERAVRKGILPRKPYRDIDYVLALDDSSRIGALRFRSEAEGEFLAVSEGKVPPFLRLNELLYATDAIHNETETAQDLRFLLSQGSPLGGARPKSVVSLPDGRLAIAKFPKPDDTRDIGAGEILALTLAQNAGITVAEHQLVPLDGETISVITRFDRTEGFRVPFLSAATLLGLPPGDPGAYTMLADGIRQMGHRVSDDLRELWRRLVFSLLASNYDDHMRNHGFLMHEPGRWALSPAYDLNPVPEIDRARAPKTAISESMSEPSIMEALVMANRFGLKPTEAKAILKEVLVAVSSWRATGRQLRLKASTLNTYASAFEQPLIDEAERLLK